MKARTRVTQVATVGIPVADQERALDFYVGTLGFEKRRDMPFGPGLRWIEVGPGGASTTIALLPPGPQNRTGIDTGIRLLTEDAASDLAHLQSAGVDADHELLRFGEGVPPMFTFRDPDGNTLYVVEQG